MSRRVLENCALAISGSIAETQGAKSPILMCTALYDLEEIESELLGTSSTNTNQSPLASKTAAIC